MSRREGKWPDNGFEEWGGYMQAKISKLEEQYIVKAGSEEVISNLFSGISIYVNGYTKPSADELKSLMAMHGGIYHTYQRSDDFIIASNLPDTKVKKMSLEKVVRPEWITESISENKLLDYRTYLLYNNFRTQPKLMFPKVNTTLEVNTVKQTDDETKPIVDVEVIKETANIDIKKTKNATDLDFISDFYNNSRLHHISQLGACFKQHINELRETRTPIFPERETLKQKVLSNNPNSTYKNTFDSGKTIMHIDMDCFFVSVGLRKRPDLIGKPVAVTHSKGGQPQTKRVGVNRDKEFHMYKQKQASKLSSATGISENEILKNIDTRVDNITDENDRYGSMSEIASCSYEARSKGLKNGMFMGNALRLCPDLQTIPYDFEGYKEVAYTLYNTVAKYTLDIEAVSCDEMYVDCTDLLKSLNLSVHDFATVLREEIREKTGCACSTGFGGNRLQARLATKNAKPNGHFFLVTENVKMFMMDIKLSDLPGVGRQTAHKLEALGHTTCGSLQSLSLGLLQQHLGGKTGSVLYEQCRGQDSHPLTFYNIRKSVSAEVNYGIRFENNEQCYEFIRQLSNEVSNRMQQNKVIGKCISLKLMVRAEDAPVETAKFMGHGFCNIINKSNSINEATSDKEVICHEVLSILNKLKIDPKEMRGIGIQVTKLESSTKEIKGSMNKFIVNKSIKQQGVASSANISSSVVTRNIAGEQTSPLKQEKVSPLKLKSPSLTKHLKSPSVRRRGRPPKYLSLKSSQSATPKNLMSKFLARQIKSSNIYTGKLCQDICEESFLTTKTDEEMDLMTLTSQQVKELIRAWIDSGHTPVLYDVKLINTYIGQMVVCKKLEDLNILLNFIRRKTNEDSSDNWKKIYNEITQHVQSAMTAIYGKKIRI